MDVEAVKVGIRTTRHSMTNAKLVARAFIGSYLPNEPKKGRATSNRYAFVLTNSYFEVVRIVFENEGVEQYSAYESWLALSKLSK